MVMQMEDSIIFMSPLSGKIVQEYLTQSLTLYYYLRCYNTCHESQHVHDSAWLKAHRFPCNNLSIKTTLSFYKLK